MVVVARMGCGRLSLMEGGMGALLLAERQHRAISPPTTPRTASVGVETLEINRTLNGDSRVTTAIVHAESFPASTSRLMCLSEKRGIDMT